MDPSFPNKPWRGGEQGPCRCRTPVSLPQRGARAPASPPLPQRLPTLAVPRGRACRGTSVPDVATRMGRFLFPSLAFPTALGKWQHMALPEASALRQLDSHPAWKPAQRDRRRKAFVALTTEGRSASFSLSHKAVAAGLAVSSQLRSILVSGSSS